MDIFSGQEKGLGPLGAMGLLGVMFLCHSFAMNSCIFNLVLIEIRIGLMLFYVYENHNVIQYILTHSDAIKSLYQ